MTLEQIKDAVRSLPKHELTELRGWMGVEEDDAWDRQIKDDFEAGRLDTLLDQTDKNVREGKTHPLTCEGRAAAMDALLEKAANAGFFDEMMKSAIAEDEAGRTTALIQRDSR